MSRSDFRGIPVSARLDEDTIEAVDGYARERGVDRPDALRRLVRVGLDVETRTDRAGLSVAGISMELTCLLAGGVGYSIGGAVAAVVAVVAAIVGGMLAGRTARGTRRTSG